MSETPDESGWTEAQEAALEKLSGAIATGLQALWEAREAGLPPGAALDAAGLSIPTAVQPMLNVQLGATLDEVGATLTQ